jgi:hypothetical protein
MPLDMQKIGSEIARRARALVVVLEPDLSIGRSRGTLAAEPSHAPHRLKPAQADASAVEVVAKPGPAIAGPTARVNLAARSDAGRG